MINQSTHNPVSILIAEDNPGDVRLLLEALRPHFAKFDLHVVDDGDKALKFFSALEGSSPKPPDLILLDLNLPKTDGREVLRSIKRTPLIQQVPVIVLSSSDSPKDRADTVELGAERFIRKPSTLDEFLEIGAIARELLPRQ